MSGSQETFELTIWVEGKPVPQGSVSAFPMGKRCVIVHSKDKELKSFRADVKREIRDSGWTGKLAGQLSLTAQFFFLLPKSKTLKSHINETRPLPPHTVKPDLDKLVRAVGDALDQSDCFNDDGQINDIHASKHYSLDREGVEITLRGLLK